MKKEKYKHLTKKEEKLFNDVDDLMDKIDDEALEQLNESFDKNETDRPNKRIS